MRPYVTGYCNGAFIVFCQDGRSVFEGTRDECLEFISLLT